jgi:hypothetical protein
MVMPGPTVPLIVGTAVADCTVGPGAATAAPALTAIPNRTTHTGPARTERNLILLNRLPEVPWFSREKRSAIRVGSSNAPAVMGSAPQTGVHRGRWRTLLGPPTSEATRTLFGAPVYVNSQMPCTAPTATVDGYGYGSMLVIDRSAVMSALSNEQIVSLRDTYFAQDSTGYGDALARARHRVAGASSEITVPPALTRSRRARGVNVTLLDLRRGEDYLTPRQTSPATRVHQRPDVDRRVGFSRCAFGCLLGSPCRGRRRVLFGGVDVASGIAHRRRR